MSANVRGQLRSLERRNVADRNRFGLVDDVVDACKKAAQARAQVGILQLTQQGFKLAKDLFMRGCPREFSFGRPQTFGNQLIDLLLNTENLDA